ncbi:MAG: hypothetical protein KDK70_30225 [Myxococcales bacterium]|nr:hypothetical protein [Myxococcales bacterium]
MGASYGLTATDLRIDRTRVDVRQHAAALSLRRTMDGGWSLGGTVGVLAGGSLLVAGRLHALGPGGAVSVSGSREWLHDERRHLFLATTWAAAITLAPTVTRQHQRGLYGAVDVSLALAVGGTIANVWSPYLSARAFGGPVWMTEVGGPVPGHDPDHHSLGCGSVLTLPKHVELGLDAALLGAQGLTASVGASF